MPQSDYRDLTKHSKLSLKLNTSSCWIKDGFCAPYYSQTDRVFVCFLFVLIKDILPHSYVPNEKWIEHI